jgi:hypothetical protein
VYIVQKRKGHLVQSTNKASAPRGNFESRILSKPFPDRLQTIQFHASAIKRGFANGDLALVNLSYAKIIEAVRQQNLKEKGAYEEYLTVARQEYDDFRSVYKFEYPQQFLPPSQWKPKAGPSLSSNEKIVLVSDNSKLKALIAELGGSGHPEYPLLRREYATESGIKASDFSGWVVEQLRTKDYDSLYAFSKEVYLGRDASFEDTFKEKFSSFLQKDFGALFNSIEPEAIFEIRAFFILAYGIDDFNREFWIAEGKDGELLAKVLSVYRFSVNKDSCQPLVKKANLFLKEMRKDKLIEYWLEFKNYTLEEIKKDYKLDEKTDLAQKLRKLSLGERLFFFDFAHTDGSYWSGASSYRTRRFGIMERQGVTKMVELGIFRENSVLEAIPEVASKGELKEAAEKSGFEVKKSWTLQKIYENLRKSDKGEEFLMGFLKDKTVVSFNEEFRADLVEILENQERIKRLVDLLAVM